MATKKIRGHNRRQRDIRTWAAEAARLDTEHLLAWERDHAGIGVHPWNGLAVTASTVPEPRGETRRLMLEGLWHVYQSWETALRGLDRPYYLKLWLFWPRFSQSQVVCGIGDGVLFYRNSFHEARPASAPLPFSLPEELATGGLDWQVADDTDIFLESQFDLAPEDYPDPRDFFADQRFLRRLKARADQKTVDAGGQQEVVYQLRRGSVYLGGSPGDPSG